VTSAEAALCGRRPAARAAARVGGHQQHDAHADGARAVDHGERELVGLLVGRPVGAVVDVVELADGRVAGPAARVEALLCHGAHAAGIERLGGGVHRLAPRPEVVPRRGRVAHFDAAAQMALEGVRVPVDEAGDEQPTGQADDVVPLPRPGRIHDGADLPAIQLDGHAVTHRSARLEHQIREQQRAAHGSIGRSRPRSRAVSRASA